MYQHQTFACIILQSLGVVNFLDMHLKCPLKWPLFWHNLASRKLSSQMNLKFPLCTISHFWHNTFVKWLIHNCNINLSSFNAAISMNSMFEALCSRWSNKMLMLISFSSMAKWMDSWTHADNHNLQWFTILHHKKGRQLFKTLTLMRPWLSSSLAFNRASTTLLTSRWILRPKSRNMVDPPDSTMFWKIASTGTGNLWCFVNKWTDGSTCAKSNQKYMQVLHIQIQQNLKISSTTSW